MELPQLLQEAGGVQEAEVVQVKVQQAKTHQGAQGQAQVQVQCLPVAVHQGHLPVAEEPQPHQRADDNNLIT